MAPYEKSHRDRFGSPDPVAVRGGASAPPFSLYPQRGRASSGRPKKPWALRSMTPQGMKPVGVVEDRDGRLVLVKQVDAERHLLRLPEESWAVDASGLRRAQELGVERVEVSDARTGNTWHTPLDYLLARGRHFDRGWGEQVALPLSHWSYMPGRRARDGQLSLY